MRRIWVDFNARNEDGTVRLTCLGTFRSVGDVPLADGEEIGMHDGEIGAVGVVEDRVGGQAARIVRWLDADGADATPPGSGGEGGKLPSRDCPVTHSGR